mmetsp:Transcript_25942/g.39853  ORF Transcript_25942/g.39853 Transcript_25942/m.39853 type:complete len:365 (-) Transcript_25942:763-1857(-)
MHGAHQRRQEIVFVFLKGNVRRNIVGNPRIAIYKMQLGTATKGRVWHRLLLPVRLCKGGGRNDETTAFLDFEGKRRGVLVDLLYVLFNFRHHHPRPRPLVRFFGCHVRVNLSLHERQGPPNLVRVDKAGFLDFLVLFFAGIGQAPQQNNALVVLLLASSRSCLGILYEVEARPIFPRTYPPISGETKVNYPSLGSPSAYGHISRLLDAPHGDTERLADEATVPRTGTFSSTSTQDLLVSSWRRGPLGRTVAHIGFHLVTVSPGFVVNCRNMWCVVHEHIASPLQLLVGRIAIYGHAILPSPKVREGGVELSLAVGLFVVVEAFLRVNLNRRVELRLRSAEFESRGHGDSLVDLVKAILLAAGHD